MTGEHGSCGCHHDDQHDNHDHYDAEAHVEHAPAAAQFAGCCGGGAWHDETVPSNQQAQRSETARSSP